MTVREEARRDIVERVKAERKTIDLTGIYRSRPGLKIENWTI